MTDRSNFLSELAGKMKEGISRINEEAKQQAARKSGKHEADTNDEHAQSTSNSTATATVEDVIVEELDAGEYKPQQKKTAQENLEGLDEFGPLDDGLVIDAEPQPVAPAKKSFDKKKLLIVGALAVAGFVFIGQSDDAMSPDDVLKQTTAGIAVEEGTPDGGEISFDVESMSSSSEIGDAGFFGEAVGDAANSEIIFDPATPAENSEAQADTTEILDPFTGEVATSAPSPFDLAGDNNNVDPFAVQAEENTVIVPVSEAKNQGPEATNGFDDLMFEGDAGGLLSGFESNDTVSGGEGSKNADSGSGELLEQVANTDVATGEADETLDSNRIRFLEKQAKALEDELKAFKEASAAREAALVKKAADDVKRAAANSANRPAPTTNQRSTPQPQRAAQAQPKATARPQICISAIAQAARNCTTCVPHAFITHKGQESMVGQGDFLEGLRVNIVGDRLDLQDANGRVVHKFWSSPNACSAS